MALNHVVSLTLHLYQITCLQIHSQAVSIQNGPVGKRIYCLRANQFCGVYKRALRLFGAVLLKMQVFLGVPGKQSLMIMTS